PKSNINYWCDKVFEGTNWNYEIQMDWSGYDTSRDNDKIYEDAYAAAWDVSNENKFIPTTVIQAKEKERLIDIEESNRYNITQTIAENFGVHCRYEYEHDSDYHIIARKVIFYNAFVQEALGPIDINYAYDTTDISREMDSKDTITKMYVKTLTDSNTESGLATISDTTANKSQEDYLLNFDYLYSIGTISKEQYNAVEPYEIEMHNFNTNLKLYERQIATLENERIEASAAKMVAKNAMTLDQERISANNALLNSITNDTGFVEVNSTRPDTCAAIESGSTYYINMRQKGIDPSTLHLYTNFTPGQPLESVNEIKTYTLEKDEFGNLIKIKNIVVNFPSQSKIIYVIYNYSPRLYYENILKTWETRYIKDNDDYVYYNEKVEDIDNTIINIKNLYDNILEQKTTAIVRFERLMGSAIREGFWQPEDEYAKYGEKHEDNFNLLNTSSFNNNLASIGWDNELFDEEEKHYFNISVAQEIKYYYCIDLSGHLSDFVEYADNLNQISFIYRNTTLPTGASEDDVRYLSILPFGSQALLRFLRPINGGTVIPVLMLIGLNVEDYSESVHNPRIGILTTEEQNNQIVTKVEEIISNTNIHLIASPEDYDIVYPRIRINSSFVKDTEDSLILKRNNISINKYEDYYILSRLENNSDLKYFITIKPELIFKNGTYGAYTCLYELSNAGLFMYLDGLQVLKENAYPRVSYEIKPTFVNDEFIRYAYKYLNYIVHINDPELKFEYVKGYITELHLKLDSPKDDTITIDNYKTKFEDLFSTIVAQTEQMQKNSTLIGIAAQAFTPTGGLQADLVQTVMNRVDLNYAFNNGTLTINEEDGIWGTSDDGVVAFRGGGIFTATEKDDNDEWIWNTGILPSGINANLITTGQLDTNLIRIFAGNDLKLQMNGDGLFAY
ncbi:MAG: hypothetical protein J6T10_05630, partial [Methanobrevibacter sp.]|nr:hypothetical protein [Methanobrevibacter sp.]